MPMFIIFLSFVFTWFFSSVILTYSYLNRRGVNFSALGTLIIPMMLFIFHLKMAQKHKEIKFIKFYFTKYKLSIIFISELLLENIAMTEAVGYSPYVTKRNKRVKVSKKTNMNQDGDILKRIKSLIQLPESISSYEKKLTI